MAETIKVFACPKCGLIIEQGTSPCPYCKTPIAWEGMGQTGQQQAPPDSSLQNSDVVTTGAGQVAESSSAQTEGYRAPDYTPAQSEGYRASDRSGGTTASTEQTQPVSVPNFRTPIVEVDYPLYNQASSEQNKAVSASDLASENRQSIPVFSEIPVDAGSSGASVVTAAAGVAVGSAVAGIAGAVAANMAATSADRDEAVVPSSSETVVNMNVPETNLKPEQQSPTEPDPAPASKTDSENLSFAALSADVSEQMPVATGDSANPLPKWETEATEESIPGVGKTEEPEPEIEEINEQVSDVGGGFGAQGVGHPEIVSAPTSQPVVTEPTSAPQAVPATQPVSAPQFVSETQPAPAIQSASTLQSAAVQVHSDAEPVYVPASHPADAAAVQAAPAPVASTTQASARPAPATAQAAHPGVAPLPETPPIKQVNVEHPPPRRRGGGRGAGVVSVLMKIIAVIAWVIGIVVLIGAGNSILAAFDPFSFDAIVTVLTENETVKQGLTFIVFGFLFFGVAEIIRLLGDYRR